MNPCLLMLVVVCGNVDEVRKGRAVPVADETRQGIDNCNAQEKPADPVIEEEPPGLEIRRSRLNAHLAAHLNWITLVCELSGEQQELLKEKIDQLLVQREQRWKRNAHLQKVMIQDYSPIACTTLGGAAGFLTQQRILSLTEEILSEQQQTLLTSALNERFQTIRRAMLSYAIAIIDDELFLTASQRESLSSELKDAITNLDDGVFTFSSRHVYLPFSLLREQLELLPDSALTDAQRKRVTEAFENAHRFNQSPLLTINGDETIDQQLERLTEITRERFRLAAIQQTSWLEDSLILTPLQVQNLTVATKGVSLQCAADWKKSAREYLDTNLPRFGKEQQLGRLGEFQMQLPSQLTLSYPVLEKLSLNPLWRRTLEKQGASEVVQERADFQRSAVVGYLAAHLDKELWLTPEQRPQLTKLIDSACPSGLDAPNTFGYTFPEMSLLTMPLFGIEIHQASKFLTEPQQKVWRSLRDQFQVMGFDIIFQMSEGRALHFELPQ